MRTQASAFPIRKLSAEPITLIAPSDSVAQNEYSKSVGVPVGGSGFIHNIQIYGTVEGSGTPPNINNGLVIIFDRDPDALAGDTDLSVDAWRSVVALWYSDGAIPVTPANGTVNYTDFSGSVPIPFHEVDRLWFVYYNYSDAINDDPGDGEKLEFNAWIERVS